MASISNKKRKLSPTPSSPSSSTPGPSTSLIDTASASSPPSQSQIQFDGLLPSSTSGFVSVGEMGMGMGMGMGSGLDGVGEGGPSRAESVSTDATPGPGLVSVGDAIARRTEMRKPTLVVGSGDGVGYGDECFSWTDWPIQNGYRYVPCALSPTPSPNPSFPFHRSIPPPLGTPNVHLSWLDRPAFLKLSSDAMTASNDRGFRSVRSNMSVREGTWYYEVYVERGDGNKGIGKGTGGGEVPNAHIRVGWGRREAILNAPVGFDGYSYGIRDTGCEKLHLARKSPYGSDPDRHLVTGDIIGCLITLPPRSDDIKKRMEDPSDLAHIKRARAPFKFKGQLYLESKDYEPAKEMVALVNREGKSMTPATDTGEQPVLSEKDKENAGGGGGGGAKVSKVKTKQTTSTTAKSKGKSKSQKEKEGDQPDIDRIPTRLEGSSISFYLNGQPISDEPAFENLFDYLPLPPTSSDLLAASRKGESHKEILHDDGTLGYYPMVSVFGRGKVRVNFGPDWLAPPPLNLAKARPMCDRWAEFREEERHLDEKEELEWIEKIQKEMADELKRAEKKPKSVTMDAKRMGKSGTPNSRGRGKGHGGHGGTGMNTPTARSRLATSVTPGPQLNPNSYPYPTSNPNQSDMNDTPASPPPGDRDDTPGVKMEMESVMDISSRATSPTTKDEAVRSPSPSLNVDSATTATSPKMELPQEDDVDMDIKIETRPVMGAGSGSIEDGDVDGESEEDTSIFE